MKKIFTKSLRLLSLAMSVIVISFQTAAAVEIDNKNIFSVGKFVFRINEGPAEGEAWLVGVKPGSSLEGEITIPGSATVNGIRYIVTRIGDDIGAPWYMYEGAICDWPLITKITIPSTIEAINSKEFLGCTGITEFHVNSGNKRFKDESGLLYYRMGYDDGSKWNFFRMPAGTKKIKFTVPADVESVWENAFADNKTIKTLILQGNTMLSAGWAHRNKGIREFDVTASRCYSVRDGLLYNGWESTDFSQLVACPPALSLTSLTIPSSVSEIYSGAFESTIIPEIEIPDNVRKMGSFVFHDSKIKSLRFTHNNKGGDWTALCANCKDLETVEIKGDAFSIKIFEAQFFGCDKLKNLTIESPRIQLAGRAFYGCRELKSFPLDKCTEIEGSDGPDAYKRNVEHFAYSGIEKAEIPAYCKEVPQGMFRGSELAEVNLTSGGNKLSYIYADAFRDCKLTELLLPNVSRLDKGCFVGNPLQKVTFRVWPFSEAVDIYEAFSGSPETWYYMANSQVSWNGESVEGVYITGVYPADKWNIPRGWTCLYGPAKSAEIYGSPERGRVVEMFSIVPIPNKSGFEIKPTEEASNLDIQIDGVWIESVTTMHDGDIWYLKNGMNALDKSVKVSFTVNGEDMLTDYPAGTFVLTEIEEIPECSAQSSVIGVYDTNGLRLADNVDNAPSGILIVRYSDGTASKVVKNN